MTTLQFPLNPQTNVQQQTSFNANQLNGSFIHKLNKNNQINHPTYKFLLLIGRTFWYKSTINLYL